MGKTIGYWNIIQFLEGGGGSSEGFDNSWADTRVLVVFRRVLCFSFRLLKHIVRQDRLISIEKGGWPRSAYRSGEGYRRVLGVRDVGATDVWVRHIGGVVVSNSSIWMVIFLLLVFTPGL